jgi:hypothetical protein
MPNQLPAFQAVNFNQGSSNAERRFSWAYSPFRERRNKGKFYENRGRDSLRTKSGFVRFCLSDYPPESVGVRLIQ